MRIITDHSEIDRSAWSALVRTSPTGNWFQTPEAYDFFAAQPELFRPFVIAVQSAECNGLSAICVGYVTVEKNPLKQFLTRRAIIVGGPALAEDCSDDEVCELMRAVASLLRGRGWRGAIYIETRNFNDYSRWRGAFEKAGFAYEPHLNFHVHTSLPWSEIEENISKHRKRNIRISYRDGATIVEQPTLEQVYAYYKILVELYTTKVKTPLQPWSFFEHLYNLNSCRYILVEYFGEIVGGSICMLLPGRGVYEWFACGKDGEIKHIYPSSVTKQAGMQFACENGYPIFDMMGAGKPGVPYGVRDFKAEFGGELVEHGRYKHICNPVLYKCGELGVWLLKHIKK